VEAKGHRIHLPVVGIFLFDGDKLLCEKVYFDSATLLRQMATGK
jgi:limonene-1,2-epoxide hydrolase